MNRTKIFQSKWCFVVGLLMALAAASGTQAVGDYALSQADSVGAFAWFFFKWFLPAIVIVPSFFVGTFIVDAIIVLRS